MKNYSIEKLARIIGAKPTERSSGTIAGVSTDSRVIKPGDCFFAIKGNNFDGHDYLDEVFLSGAACAVVNKNINYQDRTVLQVADTAQALGEFAKEYRQTENFKVVAVTGSVGKTTTREMIYHVLKRHFNCHQAPKSFNTYIGVPLTLLGAETDCRIVVSELGSNHPGEIAGLSKIAQPDIALITNVQPAHLEGFGSLQAIIEEKVSITIGLREKGTFIINGDIPELTEFCRKMGLEYLTFGTAENCDYQAENINITPFMGSFIIDDTEVKVPLPGAGNLQNALAAWAVCSKLGIPIRDFTEAVQTIKPVSGRMQVIKAGTLLILDDCYNANPGSMRNALDCLAKISSNQTCPPYGVPMAEHSQRKSRSVFVCGDMLELGDQSDRLHSQLGEAIAAAEIKLLLAAGKFAKITTDAAQKAAADGIKTVCFDDTVSLCEEMENFIRPGDIILVKGSRGCKLEAAVEKLKKLFS